MQSFAMYDGEKVPVTGLRFQSYEKSYTGSSGTSSGGAEQVTLKVKQQFSALRTSIPRNSSVLSKMNFKLLSVKSLSQIKGARLSTRELMEIVGYVNGLKSREVVEGQGCRYYSKQDTGLARSFQIFANGSVVVHLHRKKLDALGMGAFKKVTYSLRLNDGQLVANHTLRTSLPTNRARELFIGDIRQMLTVPAAPDRVGLLNFGAYVSGKGTFKINMLQPIVTPTVEEVLKSNPGKIQRLDIAKQTVVSVLRLLDQGISHNDLKWDNLFYHNGRIKLGDFGLTRPVGRLMNGIINAQIAPPEQLKNKMDSKTPVTAEGVAAWQVGVMLRELLYGQKPGFALSSVTMGARIKSQTVDWEAQMKVKIKSQLHRAVLDLNDPNPKTRTKLVDLLKLLK